MLQACGISGFFHLDLIFSILDHITALTIVITPAHSFDNFCD